IEVEFAVAIVIGRGHPRESTLRLRFELKRVAPQPERSIAVVQEQSRTAGAQKDEVLLANVAEVQEQRAGSLIQDVDPGPFADIDKTSPNILVEAVRQPPGLADIEFVNAIVIYVSNSDAVAAVDIDARSWIDPRHPIRYAVR